MKKIKVLEVNNIDLPGRAFNGYNFISDLNKDMFDIKQAVVIKQSDEKNVIKIFPDSLAESYYYRLINKEEELSTVCIYSITSQALMKLKEYKEADIIHFHMLHNSRISLISLLKICSEKKVIISLHDPWLISGRCVHFYDCYKWQSGCNECNKLDTLFPFKKDNCSLLWSLKKQIFSLIDVDLVASSRWMANLVANSPILKKQKLHFIPFGIDLKKYKNISRAKARKHYKFADTDIVIFLRAQREFKGIEYIKEAFKIIPENKNIVILTCDEVGLLNDAQAKFKVVDLGHISSEEMLYAMNSCDIFLMPSKGEAFGLMAVEAMACSKPVIIFDNTALPSVTFAPKCGYLVKDRDANDLAKAIMFLIGSPEEREKRGKLGASLCKKYYDLETYNNSIERLYLDSYNRKLKSFNANIPCLKNNNIDEIFNLIRNNETIEKDFNIDYSNLRILKYIENNNEKLYEEIINKKVSTSIYEKIKYILKKNKKLYKLLKIILKR